MLVVTAVGLGVLLQSAGASDPQKECRAAVLLAVGAEVSLATAAVLAIGAGGPPPADIQTILVDIGDEGTGATGSPKVGCDRPLTEQCGIPVDRTVGLRRLVQRFSWLRLLSSSADFQTGTDTQDNNGGGGGAAKALNRAAAVAIAAGCEHVVLLGHTVAVDAPLGSFVAALLEPLAGWCPDGGRCRQLPPAPTELPASTGRPAAAAAGPGLASALVSRVDGVVAHAGYEFALSKNPNANSAKSSGRSRGSAHTRSHESQYGNEYGTESAYGAEYDYGYPKSSSSSLYRAPLSKGVAALFGSDGEEEEEDEGEEDDLAVTAGLGELSIDGIGGGSGDDWWAASAATHNADVLLVGSGPPEPPLAEDERDGGGEKSERIEPHERDEEAPMPNVALPFDRLAGMPLSHPLVENKPAAFGGLLGVGTAHAVPAAGPLALAVPASLWDALGGLDSGLWADHTSAGPDGHGHVGPGGLAAADLCLRARAHFGLATLLQPAATATSLRTLPTGGGGGGSSYDYDYGNTQATPSLTVFIDRWGRRLTDQLEAGYAAELLPEATKAGRPVAVIWSFECGAAESTLGFTHEALGFVLALRHKVLLKLELREWAACERQVMTGQPAATHTAVAAMRKLTVDSDRYLVVHILHHDPGRYATFGPSGGSSSLYGSSERSATSSYYGNNGNGEGGKDEGGEGKWVRVVGRSMYETDSIPSHWVPAANAENIDQLWLPSRFNQLSFGQAGVQPRKLKVLPEPVDDQLFSPATAKNAQPPYWPPAKAGPGVRAGPFSLIGSDRSGGGAHRAAGWLPEITDRAGTETKVLLSMFKWERRKGWDVLLQAYFDEFGSWQPPKPPDAPPPPPRPPPKVLLVLRTKPNQEELTRFVKTYTADRHKASVPTGAQWVLPAWVVVRRRLPRTALPGLFGAVDGLVQPSRGEGWGLPLAEAMAAGAVVVGTRWSGPAAFLTEANSLPLRAGKLEVRHRIGGTHSCPGL